MALGNTGVSSLLRSASAIQSQMQGEQDALQAFNWNHSAKDQAAYDTYHNYLMDNYNKFKDSSNPAHVTKAISYMNDALSTTKAFNTMQIQDQSIGVLEGRGTLTGKLNALKALIPNTIQNGDYGTAQNLQMSIDSVQKQINDANTAAANAYSSYQSSLASTQSKNAKDLIGKLKDGNPDGTPLQMKAADGSTVYSLKDLSDTLAHKGTNQFISDPMNPHLWANNYMTMVANTLNAIAGTYQNAINEMPDGSSKDSLISDFNNLVNGTTKLDVFPGKSNPFGADSNYSGLTVPQIQNLSVLAQQGIFPYRPVMKNGQVTLAPAYQTGFRYAPDGKGGIKPLPQFGDENPAQNQQISNTGKQAVKQLKAEGYNADFDGNGMLNVTDKQGEEWQFTITPEGDFVAANGTDQYGLPSGLMRLTVQGLNGAHKTAFDTNYASEVAHPFGPQADSTAATFHSNDFSNNGSFVSNFVDHNNNKVATEAALSKLIAAGGGNTQLAQNAQQMLANGNVAGALQGGSQLGSLLQGAGSANFVQRLQQATNAALAQHAASAQALQPAATTGQFNLNQTPVNNAYRLIVGPTASTPKVNVAPIPQTPAVKVAPTAPTQPSVSVQPYKSPSVSVGGGFQLANNPSF